MYCAAIVSLVFGGGQEIYEFPLLFRGASTVGPVVE